MPPSASTDASSGGDANATAHRDLTPELLVSTWAPRDVRLSPDGRRVAWTAKPFGKKDEHPESGIWVAEVGNPESTRRWTHGGEDSQPRWSPDGTRLAFRSDRAERGTAGLYVLDVAGGEGRPLAVRKRSVDAHAWAPDGRSIAMLAPDEPDGEDERRQKERDDADVFGERRQWHRVLVVALDGGEPTTVLSTDLHAIEIVWSPTGDRLAVLAQPTTDLDDMARASIWVLAADGSCEPRRVAVLPFAHRLSWVGDGSELACVAPHDLSPCSAWTVWRVPVDGGDPVVAGPGRDEERCGVGVVAPVGERRVVVQVEEGLDTRLEWCEPSGGRTTLWTAPGEVESADVVITADGPVVAAVAASATQPPEVWAGPPEHVAVLSDHRQDLGGARLAPAEDFLFAGRDGRPLDGVLIRPLDTPGGPAPTVVLVHGGPYSRSGREPHLRLIPAQLLAAAGYAVLLPNYRGGRGHGNAFANAAVAGMGTVEWDDVMAATDASVERGIADPDRLGIGGWSQGGFLTAWAVTQTDRFRAGVMGAGVSDWGMMAATSDLPTFEAALGGSVLWDGPGPHHAAIGSPVSYAARRTTPLLIVHGANDERVPHSQAVAFYRALRDQEALVALVTYPREPHAVGERLHQLDLMRRVVAWYDRWLK